MKAFNADEPAFLLDIPSLNPVCKLAALGHSNSEVLSSPACKQKELALHDLEPNFPCPPSFPSFKSMACPASFVEERKNRGVDCFGKFMGNSAEFMNHLGSPSGEKKKNLDDCVCRNMGRMHRDDSQGGCLAGNLQASMEAMQGEHMPGFKYYIDTEKSEYGRNLQALIARDVGSPSGRLKEFMGSDRVNYADDSHASAMFALSCMSPPGDHSLWRFLPSIHDEHSTDFFSSDEFRMNEFKVRRCMRGRSHDWTECPFAHPGEKARRRDPRRFHYSGTACPDFRRGTCRRGDSCELSHGVFECWLHPARYRTQLCKDGKSCKRRVCFFAHSAAQLRYVSPDPITERGLALKSPIASPIIDAMASYTDASYKHLPFFSKSSSSVGQGTLGGYVGADMFVDDFSPSNIPGFPHDGYCPLTALSKRVQNDTNLENFNGRTTHGLSMHDISNHLKLHNQSYMVSSADAHLLDEFGHEAGIHSHSLYPYTHGNPPSDSSSFKTSQPHLNLRNQLALASLTNNIDQIMSPTSTLIGHVFSPPPLSPPLSPSESPPMSPGTAFALARKLPSLSGQPQSLGLASGMDANLDGTSSSALQLQASLLANLAHSNSSAPLFANTRGPSPLSTNSLEGKKHELDSMPTSQEDGSLQTSSAEAYPAHAMAHLISTLQQMELRRAVMDVKNTRRSYISTNTPKSRGNWDVNDATPHQRVESGQGLRAKIYGKLGREAAAASVDIENPDLAWVNELVK